jgi:hypothetical protein
MARNLVDFLDKNQQKVFLSLASPAKIQAFLDGTIYSSDEFNRCPLRVLQDGIAHCMDGALFAAAALRQIGYPPLVVDLIPEPGKDDDHMLAIYKRDSFYGAVAKSNFVGLRYREAIYHSPRELVMSYFESYYNVDGEKTLRGYTVPLNLQAFDPLEWMWSDSNLGVIERRFDEIRRFPILTAKMVENLSPTDRRTYKAGMLGVNEAGLYKPKR